MNKTNLNRLEALEAATPNARPLPISVSALSATERAIVDELLLKHPDARFPPAFFPFLDGIGAKLQAAAQPDPALAALSDEELMARICSKTGAAAVWGESHPDDAALVAVMCAHSMA